MRKMDSSSAASPGEQQTTEEREPDSRHRHLSRKLCGWRKLCASLPIVIALFLYHVPTILDEYEAWYGYGEARDYNLPPGVMDQFRVYDSNGDGFIDPFEFAVLGIRLREEVYEPTAVNTAAELASASSGANVFRINHFSHSPHSYIKLHLCKLYVFIFV